MRPGSPSVARGGRKGRQMSRQSPRSTGASLVAATSAAIVLAALVVVAVAAARPLGLGGHAAPLASPPCLVMTGSGDPAFTKNFNPFTASGLPSGQFVRGAVYEGLTVSPEGGKPTLPWLARTWKWSNGNKTLTLNLAKGVKWSDGKALTSTDVVYSLTAGRQNKVMDVVGLTRPDTNISSVKAKGSYTVLINLKTPDSQFIAATLNAQYVIPRHIVSKLGEYVYAPPTDAIGLNGLFLGWVADPKVKARAKAMSAYNPTAAKKLLTDSGFTYKGNKLYDPKGNAVSLNIHVISGWSDWVASNQIITKNLQDIGIDSNVALEPDWGSWFPNAFATKNPTLLWQTGSQASPYGYFNSNLSQNSLIPSGTDASPTGNWSHTANAQATALLNQWKVTLDPKKQQAIATQLETIFLDNMPIVPLFIGPRWSTYSTKYFHCFNSPKNFYGDPIFSTYPDNLLSLTRICPGGHAC